MPAKTSRVFVCKTCGKSWSTESLGNFSKCPSCSELKVKEARTKQCLYRHCLQVFLDESSQNSAKFCCPEHRRREKLFRSGVAKDISYFRDPSRRLDPLCVTCGNRWEPGEGDRAVRCQSCRAAARQKVCTLCHESFEDSSKKNTRKAHPFCVRRVLGVKADPNRSARRSPKLELRRLQQVRSGLHGSLADLATVKKGSQTWWGRVSELIFSRYRPQASDLNLDVGNRAPFDFQDPSLGRIDVKGSRGRISKEGRLSWSSSIEALKESCDYLFLVGYAPDRVEVVRLWLIPSMELPDRCITMSPGSNEYSWSSREATSSWGLVAAQKVLEECIALPEAPRPKDRFEWLDDPSKLHDRAPGHRGRRGELLYKEMYPEARDVNRTDGSTASYDFEHPDGTKVNVKTSRYLLRSNSSTYRWSFSRGALKVHNCDLYSCLCLDAGGTLIREYRIPAHVLTNRRVIHIYGHEGQWQPYRVQLPREGLKVSTGSWSPISKDLTVGIATGAIRNFPTGSADLESDVLRTLLRVQFPYRDYGEERLLGDFLALRNSKAVRIEGGVVTGQSNAGLSVCDAFFKHRYEATYRDSLSIKTAWDDPKWLEKAIHFQVTVGDPLLPWSVFRALKALLRTPSNFRPSVAKALVEKYAPEGGLVLDPCAGYGGRALATLALGRRYLGIDPHPEAQKAHLEMAKFVGLEDRLAFHNSPFEDVTLDEAVADMAITSPPYFSIERYAEDPKQSWVRYPAWDAWRDMFLRPLVHNVYLALRPGAVFCLNVADAKFGTKICPVVQESLIFAQQAGFVREPDITMPLKRFGKNVRTEPILVFRKPQTP